VSGVVEALTPLASASLRVLPILVLGSLAGWGVERAGLGIVAGSAALFVAEHRVRRSLFPGEWFPGLIQQVRDTVQVWRPRGPQR